VGCSCKSRRRRAASSQRTLSGGGYLGGQYCYSLTVTDFASRYLIRCDALETTKGHHAFSVFERAFKYSF
jgi:hypothetical protein